MSVGGIGGWIAAPTGGRSARSTPPRTLGSPCIISSPLGAVQARSASVGGLSACPELTTRPLATREPAPQARRELSSSSSRSHPASTPVIVAAQQIAFRNGSDPDKPVARALAGGQGGSRVSGYLARRAPS